MSVAVGPNGAFSGEDMAKMHLRKTIVDNIEHLISNTDMKKGDFETKAGVKKGYLSSISDEMSTTVPPTMFLVKASELLGVSIDDLVNRNLEELSKDDYLTCTFIRKLINQTDKQEIYWEQQVLEEIEDCIRDGVQPNILYDCYYEDEDKDVVIFYNSPFNSYASVVGSIYNVSISGDVRVYIVPVQYTDGTSESENIDYELYWETYFDPMGGVNIEPVLCSKKSNVINDYLEELYKSISTSIKKSFLSDSSRRIMTNYLKD